MGTASESGNGGQAPRRAFTQRVAVLLTLAAAALSVATGAVNLSTPADFGPLAVYVPASVQQAAGFTGALTGFALLVSAFGMRRSLRTAWYATLVLLPVTAAQGLVQASPYSVPLVVLSPVALVAVWLTRHRYDRRVSLSATQVAAGVALVGVQVYGTVGTYALREGFTVAGAPGEQMTVLDAFWFTLVTASTVGYGDITPVSQSARLFALSVLVLGTASFAIALGALLGPAIEARFASALGKMTQSQLDLLENHVVVAGYGDLTEPILSELLAGHTPYVVVTTDRSRASDLGDRDVNVVVGDPSDEATLERAGIHDAAAVVAATDDDGEDALSILTARTVDPDVRIVAAATERENVEKLKRAGADVVISPAAIGGRLLVQSALGREDMEALADRVFGEAGEPDDDGRDAGPARDA